MTNNGRSAGLHAPSGPAEQEAWFVVVRSAPLISGDVCFFGSVSYPIGSMYGIFLPSTKCR